MNLDTPAAREELGALAGVLAALGCPGEKCAEMAGQLDKRARQLMAERNQTREQSLAYLLGLMSQGWAAHACGASDGLLPPTPLPEEPR